MLLQEKEIKDWLANKRIKIAMNSSLCQSIAQKNYEEHNIDHFRTNKALTNKAYINSIMGLELFCLIDSIDKILGETNLCKFYTKAEINNYTKYKENNRIEFPIKIKCIKIDNNQYIGKCDANFLCKLANSQMINYNTNAQRTLTRVAKGKTEYYKITLNESAVNRIQKAYEEKSFIPNTITLNIPKEEDCDFTYDEESNLLIINELNHFDITDGYHRYIALSREKTKDANFNYDMELRIINFSNDKTQHFIYQEDQKTKMKKSDSNSMNISRPANIVVERLNEDVRFDFVGQIDRACGKINFSEFADDIEYIFFKQEKNPSMKRIIEIEKDIRNYINAMVENSPNLLTEGFERIVWFSLLLIAKNQNMSQLDTLKDNLKNLSGIKYSSQKRMLDKINQLLMGENL